MLKRGSEGETQMSLQLAHTGPVGSHMFNALRRMERKKRKKKNLEGSNKTKKKRRNPFKNGLSFAQVFFFLQLAPSNEREGYNERTNGYERRGGGAAGLA